MKQNRPVFINRRYAIAVDPISTETKINILSFHMIFLVLC